MSTVPTKPSVYLLQGHGCLFDDSKPPITVPEGVIWIENEFCGKSVISNYISTYLRNPDVESFLQNAPMPTTEMEKNTYRNRLISLTKVDISVKFPGETITNGYNDLMLKFASLFESPFPHYTFSGIIPLYREDIRDYQEENKMFRKSPYSEEYTRDEIYTMYKYSIYPSREYGFAYYTDKMRGVPVGIEYLNLFNDISMKTNKYSLTYPDKSRNSHIIFVNGGCRTICPSKTPAGIVMRRQNSINRLNANIGRGTMANLTIRNSAGRTKLMKYVENDLLDQIQSLIENLLPQMEATELIAYIEAKDRTEKSASDYTTRESQIHAYLQMLINYGVKFMKHMETLKMVTWDRNEFALSLQKMCDDIHTYTNESTVAEIMDLLSKRNIIGVFQTFFDNHGETIAPNIYINMLTIILGIITSREGLPLLIERHQIDPILQMCITMMGNIRDNPEIYLLGVKILLKMAETETLQEPIKRVLAEHPGIVVKKREFPFPALPAGTPITMERQRQQIQRNIASKIGERLFAILKITGGKRHRTFRRRKGKRYTSRKRVK